MRAGAEGPAPPRQRKGTRRMGGKSEAQKAKLVKKLGAMAGSRLAGEQRVLAGAFVEK